MSFQYSCFGFCCCCAISIVHSLFGFWVFLFLPVKACSKLILLEILQSSFLEVIFQFIFPLLTKQHTLPLRFTLNLSWYCSLIPFFFLFFLIIFPLFLFIGVCYFSFLSANLILKFTFLY